MAVGVGVAVAVALGRNWVLSCRGRGMLTAVRKRQYEAGRRTGEKGQMKCQF